MMIKDFYYGLLLKVLQRVVGIKSEEREWTGEKLKPTSAEKGRARRADTIRLRVRLYSAQATPSAPRSGILHALQ